MGSNVGYRSGVLGVVGALCREIGLVDVINEAAEWHTQAKMGPGERILSLIMCIFGDRRALWRVEEYYELCRVQHNSNYAELRIMPSGLYRSA